MSLKLSRGCVALLCLAVMACGADDKQSGGRAATGGTSGAGGAGGTDSTAGTFANPGGGMTAKPPQGGDTPIEKCQNLQCQQAECKGGTKTTVSGRVFDPAGKNPLYNIVVYIPNAPLEPLPTGASCDTCESLYSGWPIATALTDSAGRFSIENVPAGTDIPFVVQVGKWRREFTLPTVTECQDNPQPDGMFTLPKNQMEGDIPNIAISTGGADTLECLLRRIGIDASEYVPGPGGTGRIHIFQGSGQMAPPIPFPIPVPTGMAPNTNPPAPASPIALWDSVTNLLMYDIVLLSCEGSETQSMNQQALFDYANMGGRVFASHFHYSWFNTGPYAAANLATWMTGSNDLGDINGMIVTTLPSGMPFPKGVALNDWLLNVGALTGGLLPIKEARHNADVSAANVPSQPWIVADAAAKAPGATQYFSFNTPTDAVMTPDGIQYCGRVVYSDLHVGAASGDNPTMPVPAECADAALSPQEAVLEFMLFDLSSCVVPDDTPPMAPPIVVE